jgi:hypothetical protein
MDDKTQPSKIYKETNDREKDANDYISNDVKLIIISIEGTLFCSYYYVATIDDLNGILEHEH